MHLEPVEIQHVKLRRRPLGYDRDAVDRLLEDVTSSYEDVWFERAKLDAELAVLRNRLDGQAQAKEALEGSVRVAQNTADDLLVDARTRAQALVDDAHQRALETVRDARAEHQRLLTEVRKLEVSETEITLRLRALLTAARELLDGHEHIRDSAVMAVAGPAAMAAVPVAPNSPPAAVQSPATTPVATAVVFERPSESTVTAPVAPMPVAAAAPVASTSVAAAPATAADPRSEPEPAVVSTDVSPTTVAAVDSDVARRNGSPTGTDAREPTVESLSSQEHHPLPVRPTSETVTASPNGRSTPEPHRLDQTKRPAPDPSVVSRATL